jgi:hypothetical protein
MLGEGKLGSGRERSYVGKEEVLSFALPRPEGGRWRFVSERVTFLARKIGRVGGEGSGQWEYGRSQNRGAADFKKR